MSARLMHLLTFCLLPLSATAASWVKALDGYPVSRKSFAWALDTDRDVIVLHGGNGAGGTLHDDTWEFDGTAWQKITTATTPGARQDHAMAYDPVRHRIVLFGGDVGLTADAATWEYDGVDWRLVTTPAAPSARQEHRMAWLAPLGETVLFGGIDGAGTILQGDTWRFDGTRWLAMTPAMQPSPRYKHAMVSDAALGVLVLFGGDTLVGPGGDGADTWTFDGTNWRQLNPARSPPARDTHDMATDPVRGRIVLFGGARPGTGLQPYGDTWVFDGTAWTQVAAPSSPTPRDSHGLLFHPTLGGVILLGGSVTEGGIDTTGTEGADSWVFDGATWSEVVTTSPPARAGAAMAYDPDLRRIVLYGGRREAGHADDTWQLTASGWSRLATTTTPGALHQSSAAFFEGASTRAVMLYGGRHLDNTVVNQLWKLDAAGWTLVPAGTPTAVYSSDLVFDSNVSALRFHGGNRVVPAPLPLIMNETWDYAGATFQRIATPTSPPARYRHAMEFAPGSGPQATLVFGGTTATLAASDDTWLYDSVMRDWSQILVPPPASGRYNHALANYPPGGVIVVFGGHVTAGTRTAATWGFDLASHAWRALPVGLEPEARSNFVMEYDESRARIVLFGGSVASGTASDTWFFLDDRDGDLIGDAADGCPATPDPAQEDTDGDMIGDACDNCRSVSNASQLDSDGNCPSPPYASDPACGDACASGCAGIAGLEVQGLRVSRVTGASGDLAIAFDSSLVPAQADHVNVYRGSVAAFGLRTYDHAQLPGGAGCGRVASPARDAGAAVDGLDHYYLAAPACDASPDVEGSYGSASPPLGLRPRVNEPPINGITCP